MKLIKDHISISSLSKENRLFNNLYKINNYNYVDIDKKNEELDIIPNNTEELEKDDIIDIKLDIINSDINQYLLFDVINTIN